MCSIEIGVEISEACRTEGNIYNIQNLEEKNMVSLRVNILWLVGHDEREKQFTKNFTERNMAGTYVAVGTEELTLIMLGGQNAKFRKNKIENKNCEIKK